MGNVTVYHVAPASIEPSIELEGIHARAERRYNIGPRNIYVWLSEPRAKLYALGEAADFGGIFHVWEGIVPEESIVLDPTLGDQNSFMTSIPFRAKRVKGFVATPRGATMRAMDTLELQIELEEEADEEKRRRVLGPTRRREVRVQRHRRRA